MDNGWLLQSPYRSVEESVLKWTIRVVKMLHSVSINDLRSLKKTVYCFIDFHGILQSQFQTLDDGVPGVSQGYVLDTITMHMLIFHCQSHIQG